MHIFNYDSEKCFDYENGFYLTSDITRIAKVISHYELYKKILNLPGHVVECGVFKGASFVRWGTFRAILENPYSRKIIGFDTFDKFPESSFTDDKKFRDAFIEGAGECSISTGELDKVLAHKGVDNYELLGGDINSTVPTYIEKHPELKISLLHIDTDIYEPAKVALETFYSHIVKGGVIVIDDYGTFPGETKAVDEFFADKDVRVQKFPFSHIAPSFIIKQHV